MRIFEKSSKTPSVQIAKSRLKNLLISERAGCRPDTYEIMCNEMFRTISKYIKTDKDYFKVEVFRTKILITLTGDEL